MENLQFSVQNITDGQGIGIAITGMFIVFSALVLVSTFIAALPRILASVAVYFPPRPDEHPAAPTPLPAVSREDEGARLAAIGYALHIRRTRRP